MPCVSHNYGTIQRRSLPLASPQITAPSEKDLAVMTAPGRFSTRLNFRGAVMLSPTTTLLVYDDDLFTGSVATLVADELGVSVAAAYCRHTLLNALTMPVSCLLMNISVPEFDGFEAMLHLGEQGFKAPIILLGQMGDSMLPVARNFAVGRGLIVAGMVLKPLSRDVLTSVVRHTLTTAA